MEKSNFLLKKTKKILTILIYTDIMKSQTRKKQKNIEERKVQTTENINFNL